MESINFSGVIFNGINNGIIILNQEGYILAWNRWLEVFTGKSESEVLKKDICEVFKEIDRKKLHRKIKTALVTDSATFYNTGKSGYLFQVPVSNITSSIYHDMQQNITIIPFDKENNQVCVFIYDQTSLKETNAKLEELNQILEDQSHKDPLTNLANRRYFTEQSTAMIAFSKRENIPLAVIILDIDKFKSINDSYGHHTGDEVIIALANILSEYTRKSDIVARFGGEEFVLLLNNSTVENATVLAEKLREFIEKLSVDTKDYGKIKFTASFGVTGYNEVLDQDSIEHTISRADEALYEAKHGGRNQVKVK